jgi:hypothetical protein
VTLFAKLKLRNATVSFAVPVCPQLSDKIITLYRRGFCCQRPREERKSQTRRPVTSEVYFPVDTPNDRAGDKIKKNEMGWPCGAYG